MPERPEYLHGDVVSVPAVLAVESGTPFVVLDSPCCGARAWWPVSSLMFDHANGWPSRIRCGRAPGGLAVTGPGCDHLWRVEVTTDGGLPVGLIWTA